jgi:hypothetical protein
MGERSTKIMFHLASLKSLTNSKKPFQKPTLNSLLRNTEGRL